MKRFAISVCCLALLAGCGVGSTDLPAKKHSVSYYQEFEDIISEELTVEEYQLVRRYMRRVSDYPEGTNVSEALQNQETFETERRLRIKAEREVAFANFNAELEKFSQQVAAINSELSELETKADMLAYAKANAKVTVTFFENKNVSDMTIEQVYTIDIISNTMFDSVRTTMVYQDKGEEKTAGHDFMLANMKKQADGSYSVQRSLMRIHRFSGSTEAPAITEFRPVVTGLRIKSTYLFEELNPKNLTAYLKRLNGRLNSLEKIKQGFIAGKYSPKKLLEYYQTYGSTSWYSKQDGRRASRLGY